MESRSENRDVPDSYVDAVFDAYTYIVRLILTDEIEYDSWFGDPIPKPHEIVKLVTQKYLDL